MMTTGDERKSGTDVNASSLTTVDWRRADSDSGATVGEWIGLRCEAADAEELSRCRTNRSTPTHIRISGGVFNVSHIPSYLQYDIALA
jgi:hypothetical protein